MNFVQDTVVEIKAAEKRIILKDSELEYDYLVIGLGFESETFGITGLKSTHSQSLTLMQLVKSVSIWKLVSLNMRMKSAMS